MTDDIQVTFGADIGNLAAGIKTSETLVRGLSKEFENLRRSIADASSSQINEFNNAISSLQSNLASGVGKIGNAASATAKITSQGAGGTAFWTRELRALGDELASGRFRQADGTFLNLAVHGYSAAAAFAAANPALTAMGAAAVVAAGAFAYFDYQIYALKSASQEIGANMLINQFSNIGDSAEKLATEIAKVGNISYENASKFAAPFLALGPGGDQIARIASRYLPLYTQSGRDAVETGKELSEIFRNWKTVGLNYVTTTGNMSLATKKDMEEAVASGDARKAYLSIIDAMNTKLREGADATDKSTQNVKVYIDTIRSLKPEDFEGIEGLSVDSAQKLADSLEDATKKISTARGEALASLRQQAGTAFSNSGVIEAENAATAEKLAKKYNTVKESIKQVGLETNLMSDALKKAIEKQKELEDIKNKAFNAADISNFNPATKDGAESLNKAQENAAKANREYLAASDIVDNLRNGLQGASLQSGKLAEQSLKQKENIEGGSIAYKTQLDNLQRLVSGDKNRVEEQKRTVEGLKSQLDLYKTYIVSDGAAIPSQTIRDQEQKYLEAKIELKKREVAVDDSGLKLQRARAEATRNEAAIHAAALAESRYRSANAGGDQATLNAAKEEEIRENSRHEQTQNAILRQSLQDQIKDRENATSQYIKDLDEQVKEKSITEKEKLKLATDELQAEKKAVDDFYSQLSRIAHQSEQEINTINRERRDFDLRNSDQVKTEQRQAAQSVANSWNNAMSTINSSVEGQIDGLLRGTESLRTALKKVLASMIEDVIKFFVKWGLEASENQIRQIAMNSGLLSSTIATTAGQTAAKAAGDSASKAINATAVQGDAARAAAGAYAALAGIPIIGPVIAPPAAAVAYGAVTAFGSFDKGSWSLPSDMLAQVHAGEMIVPAAATPWAQSLMSSAASGAFGNGGGDTHVHLNVSAVDAGSVKQFFHDNAEHVASSLSRAIQNGDHLGLRALGR